MNPGIFYFYHYMPDRPPCNVGFLKLNSQFTSYSIELHVRNIPVSQGDVLRLNTFYREDASLIAISLSEITAKTNAIFVKYDIPENWFATHRTLSELDGFFLALPDGNLVAATAPGVSFHPDAVHFTENTSTKTDDDTNTVTNAEANVEADMKSRQTEDAAAVPFEPTVAEIIADTPMPKDAEPVSEDADTLAKSSIPLATAPTADAPTPKVPAPPEKTPILLATVPTANAPAETMSVAIATSAEHPAARPDKTPAPPSNNTAPAQNIRKIRRQDLRILPRKYWNLSNNSFLMHGYYNYNHLLLVEKDGYYIIGVPGIYSAREAHAANLFGFPKFTDEYNSYMQLNGEEQNNYGTFGYWCCEIRV